MTFLLNSINDQLEEIREVINEQNANINSLITDEGKHLKTTDETIDTIKQIVSTLNKKQLSEFETFLSTYEQYIERVNRSDEQQNEYVNDMAEMYNDLQVATFDID